MLDFANVSESRLSSPAASNANVSSSPTANIFELPQPPGSHLRWTMKDEIAFIQGLGSHVPGTTGDRLGLLRSYEAGIAKRIMWGALNPAEVRRAVEAEIAKEVRTAINAEIAENRSQLAGAAL